MRGLASKFSLSRVEHNPLPRFPLKGLSTHETAQDGQPYVRIPGEPPDFKLHKELHKKSTETRMNG